MLADDFLLCNRAIACAAAEECGCGVLSCYVQKGVEVNQGHPPSSAIA
jgi:hypothetical protein